MTISFSDKKIENLVSVFMHLGSNVSQFEKEVRFAYLLYLYEYGKLEATEFLNLQRENIEKKMGSSSIADDSWREDNLRTIDWIEFSFGGKKNDYFTKHRK